MSWLALAMQYTMSPLPMYKHTLISPARGLYLALVLALCPYLIQLVYPDNPEPSVLDHDIYNTLRCQYLVESD
jgi:hypothetical protein